MLEDILNKYPDWWFEAERNGISKMWVVRIAEYPSHNEQHLEDNTIFLEVDKTFDLAVSRLAKSINAKAR